MKQDLTAIREINVDLGERSYPILIGPQLLEKAGEHLSRLAPGCRCAVISDENVMALHGGTLLQSLEDAGIEAHAMTVQPGERSKSADTLFRVISHILDARLERGDLVVALGGGVIGDLAGFAAAIARRGMDFVQIPTSLLAQVDSSVGGKTGINAQQGKNLIGSFHQPRLVLADTEVLKTLPRREFAAGYAEVVKYGLIADPGFFAWLEENHSGIFGFGPELAEAVAVSCRTKAAIVAADEREGGQRALLNLGHTFGHALEGATGYDSARLVHGEGVAIGMALAHRFSARMNLCSPDDAESVEKHLLACGLPVRISQIPGSPPDADTLMEFIGQDKKVSRGKLTFILTRGIGRAYIEREVPPGEVRSFLETMVKA